MADMSAQELIDLGWFWLNARTHEWKPSDRGPN